MYSLPPHVDQRNFQTTLNVKSRVRAARVLSPSELGDGDNGSAPSISSECRPGGSLGIPEANENIHLGKDVHWTHIYQAPLLPGFVSTPVSYTHL